MQSALIASQRAAQGNTNNAQRTYQANLAYAAQNVAQGSMLTSKPLAEGGMKASNDTMTAAQWAVQHNDAMARSRLCCIALMPQIAVATASRYRHKRN